MLSTRGTCRRSTSSLLVSVSLLLPTFRRTSVLVTEWSQNCGHLDKFGGAATLQARTRHREVTDEGDCGDGSGCGNGRGEADGAARSAGGDKRRRCSDSCVGIHRGWGE